MEDLLFLAHRIPYPPNKGDKIRSYHLLRHLARHYRVHLGTFVDAPEDWAYVEQVKSWCASSHIAALSPRMARLRSLPALAAGRALSLDYYRDAGLARWVQQLLAPGTVARAVVFSSPMAQYAMDARLTRRVIDFVDIDSDKWRQYAEQTSWPMNWVYRREARCLLHAERTLAAASDAALFVSPAEARMFRSLAPEAAARIGYYNNGVDTAYFAPDQSHPSPYAAGGPVLVFTGAMDYWPNIDAVQWFASEVLPRVRAALPQARFCIVGSRPAPQVLALAQLPGVQVTGTVPDVRPYLAHAACSVAPLRVARGIQNKVLEAMAMGLAVLASPQAAEGISAVADEELCVAPDADSFARAACALLQDPARCQALGQRARARILTSYGWDAQLAPLQALIEGGAAALPDSFQPAETSVPCAPTP